MTVGVDGVCLVYDGVEEEGMAQGKLQRSENTMRRVDYMLGI